MADQTDKDMENAEKAYAAATAEVKPAPAPVVEEAKPEPKAAAPKPAPVAKKPAAPKSKPTPVKKAPAKKVAAKASAKKPATPKPVAKKAPPKKKVAAKPVARKITKPAAKTVTQTKDKTMAKSPDYSKMFTDTMSEAQAKAKEAYDKGTSMATEMGDFTKGNMEAMVESSKIFSTGVQDMSKSMVEEAKSAFETATADLKEMAAVKSPTELFQLQSKLARRNFDSMIAYSSKSSESMVKLANEAMAPLSGRMSMAADKISSIA
jgi:phasin family protein